MSLPDATALPRVNADNKGSGNQYLMDGPGDQNVATASGVLFKIAHLGNQISINVPDPGAIGMPSLLNLPHLLNEQRNWSQGPSRADMVHWLMRQPDQAPLDPRQHHLDLSGQVAEGTGQWILESKEFLAWKDASTASRFMWMHGMLGSGKTMLLSVIVNWVEREIQGRSDVALVYFYFQEGEKHRVSLAHVWATLLTQLLVRESGDLASDLKAKFNNSLQGSTRLYSSEYVDLFKAQASNFKTVYLIIDALDACQNAPGERTQQGMQDALKGLPGHIRVLYTSRSSSFGRDIGVDQELRIKPQKQDVKTYVRKRINDDGILNRLLENDRDQLLVIGEVTNITLSSGMFLLARLHMDNLSKQGTLNDVKEALRQLPDHAFDVFKASARRIAQKLQDEGDSFESCLAKHILTWVVYAKAGLNEEQIRDSFAIQKSKGQPYQEHRPVDRLLLPSCIGLVVKNPEKGTLSLVHKSLQGYLQEYNIIPKNAHLEMAKSCLSYLLADAGRQEGEPALLPYAAKYWWTHLRTCSEGEEIDAEAESLTLRFLKDRTKLAKAFKAMAGTEDNVFDHMTGLHAAVHFDLASWAERLLDSHPDVDVNAQCADGQTALHWAVRYGRRELLDMLICKSADPNIRDHAGDTPLHIALGGPTADDTPLHRAVTRSACDDTGVMEALLKGKARLDVKNRRGLSPLSSAVRYGPTAMAMLMVEGQDDVNAEVFEGWTSLRQVFYHGQDIMHQLEGGGGGGEGWAQLQHAVRSHARLLTDLLLARGVDLNRPSADGWTPLVYAAANGDLSKLRRLLTREPNPADVHLRDGEGKSPLQQAVWYGHAAAVQLLVEHGADANETYGDGSTPLINAVIRGHSGSVWVLLNAGARPDTRDAGGRSALLHAVRGGAKALVWLLLANGASPASPSHSTGGDRVPSPIQLAVDRDDLSTAWLLCEHGAFPDTVDDKGMTPLHRAARRGRLEAVRFLVDRGAAVDAKDKDGWTPLHYAVLRDCDDAVAAPVVAALAACSEARQLDVPDVQGNTALALATLKRWPATMRALLVRGASCNVSNTDGLTATHCAAKLGFREGLRLLLDNGGDANAADNNLFTPLHHAVSGNWNWKTEDADLLGVLVAAGARLRARDRDGRTPLTLANQLSRRKLALELEELLMESEADENGFAAATY